MRGELGLRLERSLRGETVVVDTFSDRVLDYAAGVGLMSLVCGCCQCCCCCWSLLAASVVHNGSIYGNV